MRLAASVHLDAHEAAGNFLPRFRHRIWAGRLKEGSHRFEIGKMQSTNKLSKKTVMEGNEVSGIDDIDLGDEHIQ